MNLVPPTRLFKYDHTFQMCASVRGRDAFLTPENVWVVGERKAARQRAVDINLAHLFPQFRVLFLAPQVVASGKRIQAKNFDAFESQSARVWLVFVA
jgi:hypothetical protein